MTRDSGGGVNTVLFTRITFVQRIYINRMIGIKILAYMVLKSTKNGPVMKRNTLKNGWL